jgi:hypothetical protein
VSSVYIAQHPNSGIPQHPSLSDSRSVAECAEILSCSMMTHIYRGRTHIYRDKNHIYRDMTHIYRDMTHTYRDMTHTYREMTHI